MADFALILIASPEEKLVLTERREINISMIRNRMQNTTIAATEWDIP